MLDTYVVHLKVQGRRSYADADRLFKSHVVEAWPDLANLPAADVTPDHVLDMLRRLIAANKGSTANKLRSYLRAAYQCAIDIRTTAAYFSDRGRLFQSEGGRRFSVMADGVSI